MDTQRLNLGEGITAIRYYVFGAPGLSEEDYLVLDIPSKSLHYQRGFYLRSKLDTPEIEADFSHVCNEDEWRFVVSNLNAMAVGEWKARYDDDDIIDGSSWLLEFCNGTNVIHEYAGSNAWPERFHHWGAVMGFVREHPAFAAAYPEIVEENRKIREYLEWFLSGGMLCPEENVDSNAATN